MIQQLSWDTRFFGYPVGMTQISTPDQLQGFENFAPEYKLVYIFADEPLPRLPKQVIPVDIKVVWSLPLAKGAAQPVPRDFPIVRYKGKANPALLELALESGVFSRFRTDPRLTHGEFKKLYTQWLQNALLKGQVFVAKDGKDIMGMITLEYQNGKARIGLVAIAEPYRGRGIAKALVQKCTEVAADAGCSQLFIPTQAHNQPAMRCYSGLGFQEIERTYVYHYFRS
jgi:dTDP-4-amino-4,6-dideoxy-D-galactose acyltransferase